MYPRHILARSFRLFDLGDDLVEMHWRSVHHQCIGRRGPDDLLRHQRTRIKADLAALDQFLPAHRNQIGRPRPGADEVDGHAEIPVPCFAA